MEYMISLVSGVKYTIWLINLRGLTSQELSLKVTSTILSIWKFVGTIYFFVGLEDFERELKYTYKICKFTLLERYFLFNPVIF